ncbi:RNA polymerase sigma factor [Paenibacillus tundrae]|uniref:RNA polymerase sigma-70 factor (ECF subfamily) n=1 Tax=Paenibacillus tundrae TaxID=528187 RepID=A0ABT9WJW0_9BACL|nr:sigma-70 family RNA polymerase sigma factor [Paenibacillus tundrae]MDQ0173575.1 RNA polymerase sigma-70 factor (ECF subfamily) [Paenibacillus tundrae]
MNDTEINQIIADVLDGEIEKFEQIMKVYQKPIFLYCYHMLGKYDEAEDNAQEVFLKTFRNLRKYTQYEMGFSAWLYKIAYHQCIDFIRKRKLVKYLPFFYRDDKDNNDVDMHIEANYFDESVHQAMTKLSAEERNLLILRCIEDKSYQEIGLILGKNTASLRKKYERTSAKFRKYYAQAKGLGVYEYGEGSGLEKTVW